jgi:hypothetical protein
VVHNKGATHCQVDPLKYGVNALTKIVVTLSFLLYIVSLPIEKRRNKAE